MERKKLIENLFENPVYKNSFHLLNNYIKKYFNNKEDIILLNENNNYGLIVKLDEKNTLCISSDSTGTCFAAVALAEPIDKIINEYCNDTANEPDFKKNIGYWAYENKQLTRSEILPLNHNNASSGEIEYAIKTMRESVNYFCKPLESTLNTSDGAKLKVKIYVP